MPEDARTVSLWDTLHDGELTSIQSDLLARTVTLQFDVPFVREFNQLPEEAGFWLILQGVQSVRAACTKGWPGGFSVPRGASREQESKLIAEYQTKCREESQSWAEFELLATKADTLDATLVIGDGAVALRLGLMANSRYYEAHIRAKAINFAAGDRQLTLEAFVRLGDAYWEAFSQRRLP